MRDDKTEVDRNKINEELWGEKKVHLKSWTQKIVIKPTQKQNKKTKKYPKHTI